MNKQASNSLFHTYDTDFCRSLMQNRGIITDETTTPSQVIMSVAMSIINKDNELGGMGLRPHFAVDFCRALRHQKLALSTAALTTPHKSLVDSKAACTVIAFDEKTELSKETTTALLSSQGVGFDLSNMNDPVAVLSTLNDLLLDIGSQEKRRRPVAGMATLRHDHPKVLDFVKAKRGADFKKWRFNTSVKVTSKLLTDFDSPPIQFRDGTGEVVGNLDVNHFWQEIATSMHCCAEPGILVWDRILSDNPVPTFEYVSTAPCAELAMAPGDGCHFMHINLGALSASSLEDQLREVSHLTHTTVRALDALVQVTLDAQQEVQPDDLIRGLRRIGVGICGLADFFSKFGLEYGEPYSVRVVDDIFATIAYEAKRASHKLSKTREPFPLFSESRYRDPNWLLHRFASKPSVISRSQWTKLAQGIALGGLRNATSTAFPPTGNSALIIGVTQGIEPLFGVNRLNGTMRPEVLLALADCGIDINHITPDQVESHLATGTVPASVRRLFLCGMEVPLQRHLAIAEVAQRHIDDAVSKTVNLPESASTSDILELIQKLGGIGLKGITVYRHGSIRERDRK